MDKKVALVSGANRGIGYAIVEGLAKNQNLDVVLGCRDVEEGKILSAKMGENVKTCQLNLEIRDQLNYQIKQIQDRFGGVDILVNNAAVLNEGDFLQISLEKFDEAIRVNLIGGYELIRAFTPGMLKKNFGRIVNISSGWGAFNEGLKGPFSYAISKAALNALTLNVSNSLKGNVKINSMCPGWVKTRMGGKNAPLSPAQAAKTAIWLATLDATGPSGQFFRGQHKIPW